MEKLLKNLSVFSLACLLAAGCSQDDKLPSQGEGEGQPVPLSIGEADLQTTVIARATTPLGEGSSIGVFIANATGVTSYSERNNVRYNRGAANWAAAGEELYLTADDAVVCAYYPYSSAVTDKTQVNLKPALLADGMMPLAYATNQTVNSDNKNVTFSLKQACSWLALNLTRAADLKDDVTISQVILSGSGLSEAYTINITDGSEITKTAATNNRVTLETGETALAKGGTVTLNISLPPATDITGGLTVGVKLKEQDKVMTLTLPTITALAVGTKYAANLTVNGSGVTASSVEVTTWTASALDNSGSGYVPLP